MKWILQKKKFLKDLSAAISQELGLSIAKEFTAVCGGTFNIKIDGDQFNVIISFPIETDTIPEAEDI